MKNKKTFNESIELGKKISVGDYIQTSLNWRLKEILNLYILDVPGDYDENRMQEVEYVTDQQIKDGYVCLVVKNQWIKSHQILIDSHTREIPEDEKDLYTYDENVSILKKLLPKVYD